MKWETNYSPSPKSRGQCLWLNSSVGAESRGCKGCNPLMVATTLSDYWRTKQKFGAVSYGLSTAWPRCMCTNSQEHVSCQSHVSIQLHFKDSGKQISVPSLQVTSKTKFPSFSKWKLLGILMSVLQVQHRGWQSGRTSSLRKKLLWNHPYDNRVCAQQSKHWEKASFHPNKNVSYTPNHHCRCSSASSILLLWTLIRIAPCSHRNTEVHL